MDTFFLAVIALGLFLILALMVYDYLTTPKEFLPKPSAQKKVKRAFAKEKAKRKPKIFSEADEVKMERDQLATDPENI